VVAKCLYCRGGPGGGVGTVPGFQAGGIIPGAIGEPRLVVAHGGESIVPPGQSSINLNMTINASGGVDEERINALFQMFVDETLIPALT